MNFDKFAEKELPAPMQMLAMALDEVLESLYKGKMGFVLMVFPFGVPEEEGKEETAADYISNANRKDIIKFLRETANRLENYEDVGIPIGNA